MTHKLICLFVCLLCFTQCTPKKPKGTEPVSKTGLRIVYKPTRGQSYIDENGAKYQLRHIPATFTNDATVPIQVQIALSKDYDYPAVINDRQFRVFPMPRVWGLDGVEKGNIRLNIDRIFQLDEVAKAHQYMEDNIAKGKLVVKM
ncbi:MAG: zinc-binding dehydrogenase [Lewinellaceae bacterium]|nr:zinc-binding dehydrogenase [Saprospiraceae bacterium]MCB9343369.1 zinc-binding dehydrogenase [Lewinellaceae bacterium]